MQEFSYKLFIFGLLLLSYSCKQTEDFPNFALGFYLVDKSTGENLVGEGKPFKPEDVTVFSMYGGDPATKVDLENNSGFYNDNEIGYRWIISNGGVAVRTDYIIFLEGLEPDTITLLNGYKTDVENIDIYLNGKIQDKIYMDNNPRTPIVKIEKEI